MAVKTVLGFVVFFVRAIGREKYRGERVSRLGGYRVYNNENRIKKEGESEGVRE